METQLYVINQFDLRHYGCPYCGCEEGGVFLSFGTCSLWGCEACGYDSAVVEHSIKEVFQIQFRHTRVRDYVGKHPYKDQCQDLEFDDCMVEVECWFKTECAWINEERLRS
jgi:hypothetical protein